MVWNTWTKWVAVGALAVVSVPALALTPSMKERVTVSGAHAAKVAKQATLPAAKIGKPAAKPAKPAAKAAAKPAVVRKKVVTKRTTKAPATKVTKKVVKPRTPTAASKTARPAAATRKVVSVR